MRRLIAVLIGIAVLLIVGASPASAGPMVDRAAEALRRDPVFVDDAAERKISGGDAEQIRDRIRKGGKPVFVAVLPQAAIAETGGDPAQLALALGRATRKDGTYAVLAGNSFRAASTTLATGAAGSLATTAFDSHRSEGPAAVLLDFVDRVNQSTSGASSGGRQQGRSDGSEESGGSSGDGVGFVLPVLLLGAAGGGGGYLLWRKRKKAQEVQDAREGLRP
ncbi:MAG: hypothetical protein H0U41_10760, partial [Actinobacteria bacterium]|nr:hypothetical protein [Actinomycetota bacterium]